MDHHYEYFWLDPKFWVAVSFVVFFVLVGRMAWARLTGMLDGRAAKVRADLDEAARLRAEAEAVFASFGRTRSVVPLCVRALATLHRDAPRSCTSARLTPASVSAARTSAAPNCRSPPSRGAAETEISRSTRVRSSSNPEIWATSDSRIDSDDTAAVGQMRISPPRAEEVAHSALSAVATIIQHPCRLSFILTSPPSLPRYWLLRIS